jgi:tRNA(Ile)-lysidine synthase
LTVDHRLRPESTAEAERVGAWLAVHSISQIILPWLGPKPDSDIQAAARAARYALLQGWCREAGILHLLLGHHRDDQAETLLLRLGRGSGVDGLSAMAEVQETAWVRLLRPLLTVPRTRLEASLAARGQTEWVDDPSNRNSAYARVRWRQALPGLAAEGLSPARLAATATRMGRARAALEAMVAETVLHRVDLHPAGYALVDRECLCTLSDELALRLLARLLLAVGGGVYPPRLERLERLLAGLRSVPAATRTLAGCRLEPYGDRVLVCREAAKVQGPVALPPGGIVVWDGRFRMAVAHSAPPGLVVQALGIQGWRRLVAESAGRLAGVPAAVRPSLPVIVDESGVSAAPHLGYNRGTGADSALRWIVPAPAFPLTVAGRCLVHGRDGIISRALP